MLISIKDKVLNILGLIFLLQSQKPLLAIILSIFLLTIYHTIIVTNVQKTLFKKKSNNI